MERRNHKIGNASVSLVIMGVAVAVPLTSVHGQTAPALSNANMTRTLNEQGVYRSLQEAVAAVRFDVRRENTVASGEPSFRAFNPAQGYDAQFTPRGLSLAPHKVVLDSAEVQVPGWRSAMRLTGYGYGENLLTVGAAELTASGKRIEYRRAWPPITEWYVNAAAGLEQGFTLAKPPGARLPGERLRVALEVTGDLIPELAEGGGESVALNQPSGDLALTYSGLRAYDTEGRALPAQMKVRGNSVILEVSDEGAAYPVTIDPTFALQTKVTAGDGSRDDRFGRSVAISGNTAVIGAFYDDVNGSNVDQGSAYVFLGNGTTWVQQAQLTAPNGMPGDHFGWSVGINGNTIVVGAPNHLLPNDLDRGSAYVFVRSGTSWSHQANLEYQDVIDPVGPRTRPETTVFGWSVAISGNTIVVGAPDVNANSGGEAFVYVRNEMGWMKQTTLWSSSNAISGDHLNFGSAVAISGDTIVVGAPYEDVRLFAWPIASPIQVDQGAAYVFVRSNGTWSQQAKFPSGYTPQGSYVDGAAGDHFGSAVAISGNRIVVGAPDDDFGGNTDQGSAYVFTRSNNSTWSLQEKLTAPDGATGDNFGHSVAITDSAVIGGSEIVVGAPYDDIGDDIGTKADQGSAYTFVCNGPCARPQKLTASDGAAHDAFGNSVAIDAGTVVVGAILDDIVRPLCIATTCTNVDQGSAYIFVR